MILLKKVSEQYDGDRYTVRDVGLRVPAGAMLVLLGGSGCGKTMPAVGRSPLTRKYGQRSVWSVITPWPAPPPRPATSSSAR
jgi:ABC-type transporter Mla maintaining outer membrane lipid asymmetry ATPase subunit MlaF